MGIYSLGTQDISVHLLSHLEKPQVSQIPCVTIVLDEGGALSHPLKAWLEVPTSSMRWRRTLPGLEPNAMASIDS